MNNTEQHEVGRAIVARFLERTPKSRAVDEQSKRVLPGGDSRTSTYYAPYPAYMERGDGCCLTDYDGNEYLDFLNNYTSLIHGHGHPPTVNAIRDQALLGTVFGSVARVATEHAQMLCDRIPSFDMVRYCNSGTEATLMAIRAARAFTGKDVIVKMDGGYHGSHDAVQVNFQSGSQRPVPGRGVPASTLNDVRVVPFNDLAALDRVLTERGRDIACVILEPVLGSGGGVSPQPGYLQGVRELADRHGVLLIFDEILTLRLGMGGLQSVYNVIPDLTTIGKWIGGGLPIGAFGGRKDIMAAFDPMNPKALTHSGTFNANNITMAAGVATVAAYDATQVARINELGQRLKHGLNAAFQAAGVTGHASGMGSLINVHWQMDDIKTSQEASAVKAAAKEAPRLTHLELLNRGVFCASRLQFAISTAMSEWDIDRAVEVFGQTLAVLRPYMADETPHLLRRAS